jgi:hypothetical protein
MSPSPMNVSFTFGLLVVVPAQRYRGYYANDGEPSGKD